MTHSAHGVGSVIMQLALALKQNTIKKTHESKSDEVQVLVTSDVYCIAWSSEAACADWGLVEAATDQGTVEQRPNIIPKVLENVVDELIR